MSRAWTWFGVWLLLFMLAAAIVVVTADAQTANSATPEDLNVWANKVSKVYHCPGTHYYGAGKQANYVYMKESEAKKQGFRGARNRSCAALDTEYFEAVKAALKANQPVPCKETASK
jgi:hypothetical protein